MLVLRQMLYAADVSRPRDMLGITRARDHELMIGQHAGGGEQQPLERRLPILTIGAEVTERPLLLDRLSPIEPGVGAAVQHSGQRTAPVVLDHAWNGPAGK